MGKQRPDRREVEWAALLRQLGALDRAVLYGMLLTRRWRRQWVIERAGEPVIIGGRAK